MSREHAEDGHRFHGILSTAAKPEKLQGDEVIVLSAAAQPRINETRRFTLVVLGCFGMVCASFGYAFNLISGTMQEQNNFSQRDMSTISTVGLVFGYFMLPFGFIFDHFGPIPIAGLAIVTFSTGTMCLAFSFSGAIAGSVVRLSVFNAFMNIGLSLFDLVSCMTVLSHFPSNKGAVVALLKTFVGIGSALVGCIQYGFFPGRFDHYFFFLTALAATVGGLLMLLMRLPPYHLTGWEKNKLPADVQEARLATRAQYLRQRPQMRRFYWGFCVLVFLIVFLPTESALVAYLGLDKRYTIAFAVVTCAAMAVLTVAATPLPFFVDRRWKRDDDEAEAERMGEIGERVDDTQDTAVMEPVCQAAMDEAGIEEPTKPYNRSAATVETDVDYVAPSYPTTFFQSLCTPQLYALWWSIFCVVGTEFVVIYNARFILGALAGELPNASLATMLTVLNGVGSAVGRLTMSYLEYWSQNRPVEKRIPITLAPFLPATSVIITIILFLTLPSKALPLPYVTAAIGNGFVTATIVLTTRTIYVNDPAKHYNFFFLASMMAALLLNRFLYGEWYSVQADKQNSKICYGKKCVLMPMLVLLGLCCTTFATTLFAHLRYVSFCKSVLAERARLRDEACVAESGAVGVLYDGIDNAEDEETLSSSAPEGNSEPTRH